MSLNVSFLSFLFEEFFLQKGETNPLERSRRIFAEAVHNGET